MCRIKEEKIKYALPPTDPAPGAAAPGLWAPVGAAAGALPQSPRLWDAGDSDLRHVHVPPRRTVVSGVGGGSAAAGFETGEAEEVVHVDVPRLPEGVVLLGGDARGVALSSTHHLEGKVGAKDK